MDNWTCTTTIIDLPFPIILCLILIIMIRWWTRSWPTPPWTESTGLSDSSPSSLRPPITHSFRWRSWLLSSYIIRTISISDNNDNLAFSRLHCRPRPRPPPHGQRWQMQEPRSFGGKALVCWKSGVLTSTICWQSKVFALTKLFVCCLPPQSLSTLSLVFGWALLCWRQKILYLMFADPLHRGHCDHESLFPWRPSSRISGREKSFYKHFTFSSCRRPRRKILRKRKSRVKTFLYCDLVLSSTVNSVVPRWITWL